MQNLEKRVIGFFSNLSDEVKNRIIAGSLLLSAIGFAIGCGGGSGGGSSNDGGGGGGGTDQVSAYVKANEGATLQLEDYKLTIPAGALKNDTTVEIGKSTFNFPSVDEMDYASDVLYVDLNNTGLNSNIEVTLPFYQSSSKTSSKTLEAITREQFIDSLVGVIYDFGNDFYSIREIAVDQSRDLLTMYYSASTLVDRLEARVASIPNLAQSANLDTNYFTQTDLDSTDPVCLLIHGFTDTTSNAFGFGYDSTKLRGYLEDIYTNRIWSFNYPSRKDIKTNVTTLEGLINALNPKFEFDIVAHSMGGDLARYYARKNPSRVRKLVMLGSPNEGVPLNAYENAFNQRMQGITDFLAALTPPSWSAGSRDLLEGSSFLSELNTNIGNISAKYCTIAGNSNSWRISGDDDGLVPVSSVHIDDGSPAQREIPESIESHTKDGTDHGGLLLYSGGCFDWVLDFLKSAEKIVFNSDRDGVHEIYTINPDGTGLERLTNNAVIDQTPKWSPDRTKIAFASSIDNPYSLELYIINADGSNVKRLTYNATGRGNLPGGWSPDGNKIVYSSDIDGFFEICAIDINNNDIVRLTFNNFEDYFPDWSPKGDKIVFASDRDRNPRNPEIYLMSIDGANVQKVTYSSNANESNNDPTWSPDGNKIAFDSNRDGFKKIYVMDDDGANIQKIVGLDLLYWCSLPHWSPDGNKLVFNGDVSDNAIYNMADMYIVNVEGTGLTNITNNALFSNMYPDW